MESQYHTRSFPAPSRFGTVLLTVAGAAMLAVAGCGTRIDTPLPDLATKDSRPVMSSAEQKQAVDALIAKRDNTARSQQAQSADAKAPKAKQQGKSEAQETQK